jgi:hypothetical protein
MLHQRVVVVELGDELVAPPLEPDEPELDGDVLLLPEPPELEPPLPLLPIELVPPLVPLLPVVVSLLPLPLLPLVLGLLPAVLLDPMPPEPLPLVDGVVLLDELVEPVPPLAPAPPPASRLLQALSESAPTTAKVAAAHCVRDIFIRNS